jgi:hypothetical protein
MADFIFGLHVLALLFVIGTPFVGSPKWILIDLMFMTSIYIHWLLNDNTCALTVLEKCIRGTPEDKSTFFGRLFGEAYSFGKENRASWGIIVALMLIATFRSKDAILDMAHDLYSQIKR